MKTVLAVLLMSWEFRLETVLLPLMASLLMTWSIT